MTHALTLISTISRSASIVLFALAVALGSGAALADPPVTTGNCGGCTTTCPADCESTACTGPAGALCDLSCNCTLIKGGTCPCGG